LQSSPEKTSQPETEEVATKTLPQAPVAAEPRTPLTPELRGDIFMARKM
jgi:hypothetical protein